MTITVLKPKNLTHEENMIYDVHCHDCPKISEENGDYLPGHMEIAGIEKNLTIEEAHNLALKHEKIEGASHNIVVRGLDTGAFRGLLK